MTPEQVKKLWEENVRRRRRLVISRMRATVMGGDFGESSGGGSTPVAFTPRTFYGDGSGATDAGVWYDTSDLSTMYVDSAGATPASVGQPVGLLLDKRLGLVRGAEFHPSANFNTPANWTLSQAVAGVSTISGGVARLVSTDGSYVAVFANPEAGAVVGKWYEVTLTLSAVAAGQAAIFIGGYQSAGFNTAGTYTFKIQATTNARPEVKRASAVNTDFSVTLFSVKELPGNHATQATTSAKPVLRQHYDLVANAPELVANTAPNFRVRRDGVNPITTYDVPGLTLQAGKAYILEATITGNVGNVDAPINIANVAPTNGALVIKAGVNGTIRREIVIGTTGPVSFSAPSVTVDYVLASLSIKEATAWRTVGAELVSDPEFNAPASWNVVQPVAGSSSISGGKLNLSSTDGSYTGATPIPTLLPVAGKSYEWVVVISSVTTGSVNVTLGGVTAATFTAAGTYRGTVTAINSINGLEIKRGSAGVPATAVVESISLKEVSDNVGYYLEFDGVDDWLRSTFTIAQPWDRVSAVQQISWTSGDYIFGGVTASGGNLFQANFTPQIWVNDGASVMSGTTFTAGINGVLTERHGGGSRLAVNNGAYGTGDTGATVPGGITIGAANTTFAASNIRFYGTVMIGRALTDAETTQVRTLLASKAGVVL